RRSDQEVDRSYETAPPVRLETRGGQRRQNAIGLPRSKNVERPQITRYECRAKAVGRLPGHADVQAFEQNLVVRRRNSGESREPHSGFDSRSQCGGQWCLCESGWIRAEFGRQNGRRGGNLGRCSRRRRQNTL